MTQPLSQANLRLVGFESDADRALWNQQQAATLAVTKENRLAAYASPLEVNDPRLMLAMQTRSKLQGSMLTPERRQALIQTGVSMGLRPFESNLVIAVVQDQARQSKVQRLVAARLDRPLFEQTTDRGTEAHEESPHHRKAMTQTSMTAMRWVAAIVISAAAALLAARWIMQGG